jgi:hypothetical protein
MKAKSFVLPRVPYKRVTVFWRDIVGDSGWKTGEDNAELGRCYTRGWLVEETSEHYVIASTIAFVSGDIIYSDTNTIPKSIAILRQEM